MHATPQWGEEGCSMLRGLMQDAPLLISGILEYAARAHGEREIVSKAVDEPVWRYDWHRCDQRARQAAQALGVLGIATGDRVSSLAWNTHRHLELFYAAPGMGAVSALLSGLGCAPPGQRIKPSSNTSAVGG